MENSDNKKIKIIIASVAIAVVVLFILLIVERVRYQKEIPLTSRAKLVHDYSKFYTIDDCINKYISYISSNNNSDLLKLLNSDYAKERDINVSNAVKKLDIYDIQGKLVSFESTKMYEEKKKKNNYTYYVVGEVYEEKMDTTSKGSTYYFIVNVDYDTLIFDIMSYDGSLFKEIKE